MQKFTKKILEKPPCVQACPAQIDIPRYIRLIRDGDYDAALSVIREKIPLPSVCGRVCYQPCEDVCKTDKFGGPVAINALKRFAAEHGSFQEGPSAKPTGKRVAIIGSGPGGLTAAYYLAKLGHGVTVYEVRSKAGGMLYYGIPRYVLPEDVLVKEIDAILNLGIELKLNAPVQSTTDLPEDKTDAIVLATGFPIGKKLTISGSDLAGVYTAVDFLRDVGVGKADSLKNKRVVVLGGGRVAIDIGRTVRRLGASDVHIVYRRTRPEMSAGADEVKAAEEEGIIIHFLQTFVKIVGDDGQVKGVECVDLKLVKMDEDGEIRFDAIESSAKVMAADAVFFAIGQTSVLDFIASVPDVKTGKQDTIVVDPETFQTGSSNIFALGDVVSGPASVIEAMAMARKTAFSIDKYLGGDGKIDEKPAPPKEAMSNLIPGLPVFPRCEIPALNVEKRLQGFDEVYSTFSEALAREEANRCLMCDLPIEANGANCTVCLVCQMVCAFKFTGNSFNVSEAAIKLKRTAQGTCDAEFTDKCDDCGLCVRYCSYEALTRACN
ncbi:MAG: hypothetical protein AUJ48_04180 [Deltaproteobacteria bacterium CG1_02_45_11]|nr:MAG: hypothetical protein AUJ48_04180 [Deltaproteobacteria bacterium CG1_02_45_11]